MGVGVVSDCKVARVVRRGESPRGRGAPSGGVHALTGGQVKDGDRRLLVAVHSERFQDPEVGVVAGVARCGERFREAACSRRGFQATGNGERYPDKGDEATM